MLGVTSPIMEWPLRYIFVVLLCVGGGMPPPVAALSSQARLSNYRSSANSSRTALQLDESSAPTDSESPYYRCPSVEVPRKIELKPGYTSIWSQEGVWRSADGGSAESESATFGKWRQSFTANAWRTVTVLSGYGVNEAAAYFMEETSLAELHQRKQWQIHRNWTEYPALLPLQKHWDDALFLPKLEVSHNEKDLSSGGVTVSGRPSSNWTYYSIENCNRKLLFVVALQDSTESFPGAFDIYDWDGILVAHSLTHSVIDRHLLVQPSTGYLIASAEAPTLQEGRPFLDLPKDASRGGVLSYQVQFEEGGYTNASLLLQENYRWVVASAVQLRAIVDGRETWTPLLPSLRPWIYVALGLVIAIVAVCLIFLTWKMWLLFAPEARKASAASSPASTPRRSESANVVVVGGGGGGGGGGAGRAAQSWQSRAA